MGPPEDSLGDRPLRPLDAMEEDDQDVIVVVDDPIGEEDLVVEDHHDQEGRKAGGFKGALRAPYKSARPNPDPELGEVDPVHILFGKEPNSDGEIVTSVTQVTRVGPQGAGGAFVVGGKSPVLAQQLAIARAQAENALEDKEEEDEVSLTVSSSAAVSNAVSNAVSDADEDQEEIQEDEEEEDRWY